jgi:prepilin-type N-terminal cleavage/methylation domain-containing protein/prepilin-type processing-associated H-X9-DG protein
MCAMISKRQAFTLIELLVVIAIIALLLAILVPALHKTREGAKAVVCSSNVKQLLVALTSYESQNHTFPYSTYNSFPAVPPPEGYPGNPSYDRPCWWWFNFIADYVGKDPNKGRSVLWCPSRCVKDISIKPNILCGNYGVNQAICRNWSGSKQSEMVGKPLSANQILHHGQTMLVMDSGYSTLTWWHATDTGNVPFALQNDKKDSGYVPGLHKVNKPRLPFRGGVESDALNGRHPKKMLNAGFVDGHTAHQKPEDFYVEKVGDDFKNRSPLWLP